MIDSHAHIGRCEGSAGEIVADAARVGVQRILTVGLDERSNREAIETAAAHEAVFACVGRHPNGATGFSDDDAAAIEALAAASEVVAIGETGLDFFRDGAPRDYQRRAFRAQIEIARRVAKPLVIHVRSGNGPDRDAVAECFEVLAAEADGVTVILHCFSAPPDRVAGAAERGWYCSFAGNVTYPKSDDLREAAALVPDDLILVETDAPYLSPQSRRGKPNSPAMVTETAEVVAAARGTGYSELEQQVERNARTLFGW